MKLSIYHFVGRRFEHACGFFSDPTGKPVLLVAGGSTHHRIKVNVTSFFHESINLSKTGKNALTTNRVATELQRQKSCCLEQVLGSRQRPFQRLCLASGQLPFRTVPGFFSPELTPLS